MACRMDVYDRAKELGIQTEFVDGQGHRHVTDATALKIILDALPERIPSRLLDGPVVIRAGEASRTELSPAAALPVSWKVVSGRKIVEVVRATNPGSLIGAAVVDKLDEMTLVGHQHGPLS